MRISASLTLFSLSALVALGCGKAETTAKTPESPAKKPTPSIVVTPDKADGPFHPDGPKHGALAEAAPPAAKRTQPAETVTMEHATIIVSDVEMGVGETAQAAIEVRPAGAWKFNADYPVRVSLVGISVAETARSEFNSKKPHGMLVTGGGMRLDILLTGQAAGEDRVTATIKFGVCSASSCLARKAEASFRVAVR
ncbi:MAG: hypothetical protein ACI9OJ_001208 [Myxococcota bacterium]|jgi:hypothetical protein